MAADSFRAEVRVGKGLRPVWHQGALHVEDGTVTLHDGGANVIAQGQVGAVWAHKARFPLKGLQIHIDGAKYTLDQAPPPLAPRSPAVMLSYIKRTDDLSDSFLAWFDAHGGNVGQPS